MVGGNNSILDRLSNNGGKKDALAMYKDSQVNPSSEFFRLILKKYCSIDVLGVDPHTSPYREKGILDSSNRLIRILDKGKINE